MKTYSLLVVMVAMVGVVGCKKKATEKGGAKAGLPCDKAKSVEKGADGRIRSCTLAKDHRVGQIPCRKGTAVRFHKNGKLQGCALYEPVVVEGFPCKKSISFDKKGKVYYCEATSKSFTAGGATIPAGSVINPFGDGTVRYANPTGGKTVSFKAYQCSEMKFLVTGQPERCKLASAIKIGDKEIPAGKRICFDKSGKVVNGSGCVTL